MDFFYFKNIKLITGFRYLVTVFSKYTGIQSITYVIPDM